MSAAPLLTADLAWTRELPRRVPGFLARLEGPGGFYRYSLSGDLHGPKTRWGLGNTVFAVKCLASLGALDGLAPARRAELARFILSFRRDDGLISDPLVVRASSLRNKLLCLRTGDFTNFFNARVRSAETRQALLALALLGHAAPAPAEDLPASPEAALAWLASLDWTRPWAAGSHFSHLLYFYTLKPGSSAALAAAVDWARRAQREDGAWGSGTPSPREKLNGAMKVLTGLTAAGESAVPRPERLIDLCLASGHEGDACDQLNAAYVLRRAAVCAPAHRAAETAAWAAARLDGLRRYYHPQHGGFSFHPGRANTHYYGARLSRGLAEPDVHGTSLLLWGVSLLAPLAGVDCGVREVPA